MWGWLGNLYDGIVAAWWIWMGIAMFEYFILFKLYECIEEQYQGMEWNRMKVEGEEV